MTERFSERKGETKLLKSNLGIEKEKKGNFETQIGMNFFLNCLREQTLLPPWANIVHTMPKWL